MIFLRRSRKFVVNYTYGGDVMKDMTSERLNYYRSYLISCEKAAATVGKYVHDVEQFIVWLNQARRYDGQATVEKSDVLLYKQMLCEKYAPASVNAALSSLNSYFSFCERPGLRVRNLKIQRQLFAQSEKELTREEYERLLATAKARGNERLYYLMQTIAATGIRVSEVQYITVEALQERCAHIYCKGKYRRVILASGLCKMLKKYIKGDGIQRGAIFVSKHGRVLDRSNIWAEMKKLCRQAGVPSEKVYPHNLRHLFARTFYSKQKDIVRLADILGHSSVNTTRIYTVESGEVHRRQLEELCLLRC